MERLPCSQWQARSLLLIPLAVEGRAACSRNMCFINVRMTRQMLAGPFGHCCAQCRCGFAGQ